MLSFGCLVSRSKHTRMVQEGQYRGGLISWLQTGGQGTGQQAEHTGHGAGHNSALRFGGAFPFAP